MKTPQEKLIEAAKKALITYDNMPIGVKTIIESFIAAANAKPEEVPLQSFLSVLEENYLAMKHSGRLFHKIKKEVILETYEDLIAIYKANYTHPSSNTEQQWIELHDLPNEIPEVDACWLLRKNGAVTLSSGYDFIPPGEYTHYMPLPIPAPPTSVKTEKK